MKPRLNVAVVGATGAVGTEMLRVLQERRFPYRRLRLLASPRSTGRRIPINGPAHRVEALEGRSFEGIDLALFSAGANRSLEFAPEAVKRGAIVIDNSSAFRLSEGVPLVVPEVNAHTLAHHRGLIANPNCSTIILVVALAPLHRAARLTRVTVATYQAVSGAGAKAIVQLYEESKRVLRGIRLRRAEFAVRPRLDPEQSAGIKRVLPTQIAFNAIPQVDMFLKNGSTREELKMENETRKILEEPALPVSATCVRVPVFLAHSEAVWIETERALGVGRARAILRRAPGVRIVDRPEQGRYPMPLDAGGQDEVLVGRLRSVSSIPSGLVLWLSGDNLRKGAATNAVQIAELLVNKPLRGR